MFRRYGRLLRNDQSQRRGAGVKWLRNPAFWAIPGGLLLVVLLGSFRYHYTRYTIPQNGMYPDMPAGTTFWATRHPYRTIDEVRRGDVIVFRRPRGGVDYDYVWRVIGLPSERIAIHDDAVTVNGQPLSRTRLKSPFGSRLFTETAGAQTYWIVLPARPGPASDFAEVTVPPGHVFVLGDNRHDAYDSRSMGPVPFESILARAGFWD
jgi:signal peptidase I